MLLVLGMSILAGEIRIHGQVYNVLATRVAAGLLCLTTVALLVPVSPQWPLSLDQFIQHSLTQTVYHRDIFKARCTEARYPRSQ
jgi:Ca2+/H+ antiporter